MSSNVPSPQDDIAESPRISAQSPFRSIRHTLFNEGKLLRYLGYAIGEVILIIVGILFALKINDWNEDRKAQAEFDEYIVQLKVDVQNAIQAVESSKRTVESFKEHQEYVLEFLALSEFKPEELEQFERGLTSLGNSSEPQVYVGLFGDLLNGNTGIIERSRTLTNKARETERRVKSSLNNITRNRDRIGLSASNLNQFLGPGSDDGETPPDYDLEHLRASKEFVYTTKAIIRNMGNTIVFDERIIERLQDFLTVLEEYE